MTSADATSGSDAADEATAAAIDPAAPLRGPAFEGADDASLGDDEWLARAIAAAAEAGLVRDARAVAERLGEVGLEDARKKSETPRESDADESAVRPPSNASVTIANVFTNKHDERVPRVPVGWLMNQGDACLLVDNYDSYTYNLFHLIAAADGTPPVVIKNDRHAWDELVPSFKSGLFTRVVLSPGPGNPNTLRDVGVCRDIVDKATETPVWGVCLGHQLLAAAHGVEVRRARVPTHGVVSAVRHDGQSELFEGVPERFEQTRYHSLAVDAASLAREGAGVLRATAWTEASDAIETQSNDGLFVNRWVTEGDIASARAGGEIMALEHVTRPHFGVQFHPESVCSEPHGARMYANFKAIASRYRRERDTRDVVDGIASADADGRSRDDPGPNETHTQNANRDDENKAHEKAHETKRNEARPTKLLWMRLPNALAKTPGGAETLFWSVVAPGAAVGENAYSTAREHARFLPTEATRDTFWLDSATADVSESGCARSRFSFMGGAGGELWRRAVYRLPKADAKKKTEKTPRVGAPPPFTGGRLEVTDAAGKRTVSEGVEITAYLEEALEARRCGARERVASWAENARRRAREGREREREREPSRARPEKDSEDDRSPRFSREATETESVTASTVTVTETETNPAMRTTNEHTASEPSVEDFERKRLEASLADDEPPFDFVGGFVGYLGYETRAECGSFRSENDAPTPDAAFFFADRFVVADHLTGDAFVAALTDDPSAALRAYVEPLAENENRNGLASAARAAAEGVLRVAADDAEAAARAWMAETERAVLACADIKNKNDTENMGLQKNASSVVPRLAPDAIRRARAMASAPEPAAGEAAAAGFAPRADRDAYVRAIVASQDFIDAGETYEVCLTNQLVRGERTKNEAEERKNSARSALGSKTFSEAPDPATLYSVLRATNPAPYAAYLCFGGCEEEEEEEDEHEHEPYPTSLPGARAFVHGDAVHGGGDESGDASGPRDATNDSYESPGLHGVGEAATNGEKTRREEKTRRYAADDVLAVCCCSPERFLRLSKRGNTNQEPVLEAKPIKGTARRHDPPGCAADIAEAEALAARVKDRAENLMIVDLLRNDLGRVCVPGSVSVPGLMKIESYATVHQLVSTVRGTPRLNDRSVSEKEDRGIGSASSIACVAAAFPPGSMTGAPKARTCEIIESLEDAPRGVYSGAIGFFSAAGDAFDLNVCIRTCVVRPATGEAWIGCGGAITALSDADEEWEETRLKARAVLRAVRAVDEATDAERASRARSCRDEPS